jgi:hypothetical protein
VGVRPCGSDTIIATPSDADERGAARQLLPNGVRRALFAALGLLLAGALYLLAVRGEPLLLDLAAFSRQYSAFDICDLA